MTEFALAEVKHIGGACGADQDGLGSRDEGQGRGIRFVWAGRRKVRGQGVSRVAASGRRRSARL